jgi:dihydroxy-acid dehydratase
LWNDRIATCPINFFSSIHGRPESAGTNPLRAKRLWQGGIVSNSEFLTLDLFRISDFGFRISDFFLLMSNGLNWNSRQVTHGWQRGVNAFFWGLGFSEGDFDKAQVGIGVPLLDGNICNVHAHALALKIKAGCTEAGLIGFPFGVPGVSDNITQGHEGGNASLPSRNIIANCAEMVVSAHRYDALVGMHHCDKNGPGFAMALARLNYPGLLVSGGSIVPGCHNGRDVTILDAYDAQAKADQGLLDRAESEAIIRVACPGPGGCGIAASFNTWGIAMEAIGLMLPDSSSIPAVDAGKTAECARVGAAVRTVIERNIRPRDVLTKPAFVNAMTAIAAAGGSTNGVLHLLALAREAQVDFSLRDVQAICRRTPVLANFAPRGRGTMNDLHRLGGTTALLRHFLEAGLLDGSCLTITGQVLAQNCDAIARVEAGGSAVTGSFGSRDETDRGPARLDPAIAWDDLLAPAAAPFKPFADIQICFGNVAPDGIVFKASSLTEPQFRGKAICFTEARAVSEAAAAGRIRPGHVVVLRGLGPVASGMPEVLVATAALSTPALDGKVALISDTRVSGVSHGCIGVHCAPGAAIGGPIGRVLDGDLISFDLLEGSIHVEADLDARPRSTAPIHHVRTFLADFAATAAQAHLGCVSRR